MPLILCAIEAVRRFHPKVYELIWTNSDFFSSSAAWWKSRKFTPPDEEEAQRKRIRESLQNASQNEEDTVRRLLTFMFPDRMKILDGGKPAQSDQTFSEGEKRKSISHPDYFPIYFYRTVPDVIFSSREITRIIGALREAPGEQERRNIIATAFDSLERRSVREFDFLVKLTSEVEKESMPLELARSVGAAVAQFADKLSDEMFVSEVRRGLSIVFTVAQRLATSDEINAFLEQCIALASTDSFAARIYSYCTDRRSQNNVLKNFEKLSAERLKAAFTSRMTLRYGPTADVNACEPTMYDVFALSLWAKMGSIERDNEVSFWRRYIGSSRAKLAEAFDIIAPPDAFWDKESPQFVDLILPIELLRKMDDELPRDSVFSESQEKALGRLKSFLDGDLRPGLLPTG